MINLFPNSGRLNQTSFSMQNLFNWLPKSIFILIAFSAGFCQNQIAAQEALRPEAAMEAKVKQTLKQNAELIRFMENKGQLNNKDILYYLEGKQGTVYIEKNKIRFVAKEYVTKLREDKKETERFLTGIHNFTVRMEGANPEPKLKLGNSFSTNYNYFLGEKSSDWVSGVRAAKDLTLEDIYPGIDIRLYSNADGSLEFDWIMDAGADFNKINMLFEGQDKLSVGRSGELKVGLRFTDVKFNVPESYQVTESGKQLVNFAFKADDNRVTFKTKSKIDPQYPLIIDPVLSWGTFMDGNDPDFDQYLFGIQVDPIDGTVYCAGATNRQISTSSPPYDANGYLNVITGFGTGANPRVAIVYRVSSSGNDLIDLTLYGPNSVGGSDQVAAYGLSLSDNRVFISGRTTVDLPMTGGPFDGTRDGNDGFVAIFSRNLGTLHYSTYIGSSGAEDVGVPSIRAINDNTYVLCAAVTAALPGAYISGGSADGTFGGTSEGYVAKFNTNNILEWGTYVGGSEEETLNDVEVFTDGRVAFGGWGNNTDASMTEFSPASSGSNNNGNLDGLIGVLTDDGSAFNYLEEIGGGNADKINDVEIINGIMAFTGAAESGFPTTAGVVYPSNAGNIDMILGVVNTNGGSGYKATYFGGSGADRGAGVQKVFQVQCDGTEEAFLLVFGTCESGIPTKNINGDPFFDSSNNGGLDMFFAGFNDNLTTLNYATNIGGQYNDYLGDTGDPRGANHLWVKGANIYVGTTTHSASHSPTIVSGGFDTGKSNTANPTSDDTHVLFSILFSSLLESDYSDAPASYGAPSHTLDCAHIRINTLDSEAGATPGVNANGDDLAGLDDEDGISVFPVYQAGGPQTISITANGILNTTGFSATLFGWIDFNNDGMFSASEAATVSVANGFSGSKTLIWTGVTVAGTPSNQYLRLRLTSNALSDDGSTASLDERSTVSAGNGEVEDYYICVKPTAGVNKTVSCAILPGGSATMTATGTGTWAAKAGNPGTATITNTSSPTTTITNYSVAGDYFFIWTNSTGCATDTVIVSVTAKPNAGTNKTLTCAELPGGSVTMSGTGAGTWTAQAGNPGTATITDDNDPVTTITTFSAAGTYNFIWTNASNCTDTASVTVTAKPDAGDDKTVSCVITFPGGSTTMNGTGTGTWTAQAGNPGTATITNASSPTTTITTFSAAGTYNFIWTNGSCKDTASVTITGKPNAGVDKNVNCVATFPGGSTVMAGTGTGTWTAQAGNPGSANIVTPSSPTTTINTFTDDGDYFFIWTNGTCTDTAKVVVTMKPNAGGNQNVNCVAVFPGGSATMAGVGTGTWTAQAGNPGTATISTPGSPTTNIINFSAAGTYNFIFTNASNCTDTASVIVTAKPNGGVDQNVSCVTSFPGGSATMAGSGTGTWTAQAGNPGTATITNSSSPTTTITNFSGEGTYHFIWTNGACSDTASVNVSKGPIGSATPQTICSGFTTSVALNSTIPGSTFTWTAALQSGSITGFSNCAGACGTTISQTLTNTSNAVAGVVRYTVTPTAPNGCIGNPFTVDVTVNPKPVGSASNESICSGGTTNVSLSATVPGTTFTWTAAQQSGSTITGFSNCASSCGITISQTLTNTSNANPGVVRYTITPTSPNGCIGNTFTVDVTVDPKPQGSAAPQTICSGFTTSVGLSSTVAGTTFTWTAAQQSGSAITGFSNCGGACGATIAQTLTNTSNAATGVVRYTVTPTTPAGCIGNAFTVDVTVNPLPIVTVATTPSCIAQNNGTATANVSGGLAPYSYNWNNGQVTQIISGLGASTYSVTVTDANGCSKTANGAVVEQGISSLTAVPGPCNSSNNTYSLTGSMVLLNAPNSGTLTVSVGATQQVFNAPFTSPQAYVLNGLIADGAVHTVTAIFSGGTNCSKSTNYTAPVNCLPIITHTKSFTSATQTGAYTYDVVYKINVSNSGGAGQYDLSDFPSFDDDIAINNASYTTTAPGNPGGVLGGSGPWLLANDQAIAAGASHMFTLTVNVTINLNASSGGNNVYTKCGQAIPGNPSPGEGLYNLSKLDTNNDGTPEETYEACGDLPYVTHDKTLASIVPLGGNMYNVTYQIVVKNLGGVNSQYDLVDQAGFDDDITINNTTYTSNAPGNPGGPLAGSGPWTMANNQAIGIGSTHTYNLVVKVTLDLNVGSGGDNVYKKCGQTIPGTPVTGEGLFNKSKIDTNDDGTYEETDEVCGDLPYIISTKTLTSITPLGGNMYNVVYQLVIKNLGGASGQYDLNDTPGFDNDITINTASYTSNAPGNAGAALAGNGPWSLANDQAIISAATHTYTLTVKVTLDLTPGTGGDNVYTKCGQGTPGNPSPGEGLFNESSMDSNNDGIPESTNEVCGDIPYVIHDKTLTSISPLGGNMYNVVYQIVVTNSGGATGQYDLTDTPGFDDDIAINSASFTTTAPGPSGVLAGSGPWVLANDINISAGTSYTYTLTVKVTIDLSAGSGGNNTYTKCGQGTPGDPTSGEGLYNESKIDSNNDGVPEQKDEVCGDLPYITHDKTIASVTPLGGNMYNVTYKIVVQNLGGASGQYDLKDIPGFDDDFTINTASYTSNAPGNAGGALAGTGPWTLANNQAIIIGGIHTYNLLVKTTLDLTPGSSGDNIYKTCGTAIPGDPSPGEGLYNQSSLDTNDDGTPEETDEVCTDLPFITNSKTITGITNLGGNMYNVTYQMVVKNQGGVSGQYDLTDIPGFDDDITINSASFTTTAPGNPGGVLAGIGPWTLANDQTILAGATHTFTLTVKVTIDLTATSGGNNVYTKCGQAIPGDPTSGEGLYNQAKLDTNNDGVAEDTDEACGDLPYVIHDKTLVSIAPLGANMYNVTYQVIVTNSGGAVGQYDLTDTPGFDDDITINTASYTSNAAGNPGGPLAGVGPWALSNDQNITAGTSHTYTLVVKVTLDLNPGSAGDNIYKKCGQGTPGDPTSGEGLYNESKIDINNDGTPEQRDEVCGDLPFITHDKTIASVAPLGGNMYNVTYQIVVKNLGGATGQYDLTDIPGFDDDFTINTASYTSNAPGNAGSGLVGIGPWILANDQTIFAAATHTFTLVVKTTLDLTPGSGGDNIYKTCGTSIPGDPSPGEGLYNQSKLDSNNDGTPEETDEVCTDLPFITNTKTITGITPLGGNMYNVTYQMVVKNQGGVSGTYDLTDIPGFDDDITINNASYTTNAPLNPGGVLAGTGPWSLANDQVILAGATHTYTLTVKVTLDLSATSGGNNVYTKCGQAIPGDPTSGEGLYNQAKLDTNNDGIAEDTDEACGDLPYITHDKTIASIAPLGGNMFNVTYQIVVKNTGGANGQYDLTDTPGFDDDIEINTSSYTSNAPGNAGSGLVGVGPWLLANDLAIIAGATHTYQLVVKVTIDLGPTSGGNNSYTKCGQATPGDPTSGEGLYNESKIDANNDGVPEEKKEACGDLPFITSSKSISSILPLGGNMFNVTYQMVVKNIGGATGTYTLVDAPGFDDDIAVNTANYTSTAPGNPGAALAGVGPWTLASAQSILVGATHTYTLVVKVTLDLTAGSGGNNVYTKCGQGTPGDPASGEGLYNQSKMDSNNDGTPEDVDEVCADIPFITHDKTIASIAPLGGNMYNVTYQIVVKNLGGANGEYDLSDIPGFDDDITINTASYTSNASGNPGGALAGTGPWTLANNQAILVGATHTYSIIVKVTLDLNPTSGGNNLYTKCGQATPGDPTSGEGLYNQSKLDSNNDGTPEETKEVCGDLPFITSTKLLTGIASLGGNMYNVTYQLTVKNLGGANGQYDLTDIPGYDDDITINTSSYTSTAPGNAGGPLVGSGPWTLANDQAILTGATHTYTLTVKVTIDLSAGSSGNNAYTKCGQSTPGNPAPGEGLYNEAKMDSNNDGVPEETPKTCGDLPYVIHNKTISSIAPLGGNMYNVTYQITVNNNGGATGVYDLTDIPGFDDDININSASYTSTAAGNPGGPLAGVGPWVLGNNIAIIAGATQTYTLIVKVTLDLTAGSGGNNVYTKCGQGTPGDPTSGEGLYNQSKIDHNDDGIPEDTKEACGDLPSITHDKTLTSITPLGANKYQINYQLVVKNQGGAIGQYDLTDIPGFDDDITINTTSFTSNAPGNPGAALAGTGPWLLANNQSISAGATHTYQLVVKVTIDLNPSSGGNNVYNACGALIPNKPVAGEGLFNRSTMDNNDDGIAEETREVCGDLPYVTSTKSLTSIAPLGGNMYTVTYNIDVKNIGGANGQYDLLDVPAFDNDITIGTASFASNAPGNSGAALAGSGPWTLANDQNILVGATHNYTVTIKVTIDLRPTSGGDNVYKQCGLAVTNDPSPGEGLYNEARMDNNNDGTPEEVDEACGDLPYVTNTKTLTSITPLGGNMFQVNYQIVVKNLGGVTGQYNLTDAPGFDNDITINNASYSSNVIGNPGTALAGSGPWTLASDQIIAVGAIHTYQLLVKVTMDLNPGSGGDNVYTKCGQTDPAGPKAGEGLFNESRIDSNDDGTPDDVSSTCGDIPYVTSTKVLSSIIPLGGNSYNVNYTLEVKNLGGVNGQYDLFDAPGFDNDIAINNASYTTTAPGNPGGALGGNGPWTLANDQAILVGATHTYQLTVKVTLDLNPASGADNIYTKCAQSTPGDPKSGEGLYNESRLDNNNDGTPEELDEACGDIPYVTHDKTIASIIPVGGNAYDVSYQIVVKNLGGANGQYDLTDIPSLENDITIGTVSYTSTAPGNAGGALAGTGPWSLANDQAILTGATHTYVVKVRVTIDLNPGSGGDDVYLKCGQLIPGTPTPGEGLFNRSKLDSNNDGIPEETDEICGDLPYVTSTKTLTSINPLGGNMYQVNYKLIVKNLGGALGQYDLKDNPGFDNDIAIGSASFTSDAPGNAGAALAGTGPWTLANDQNILVGATHNYDLSVKVTLDLRPGTSGDNLYKKCGQSTPGDPTAGEGLYNESTLDNNNDGTPEEKDEVCGDIPYVTSTKTIVSTAPLGGNMFQVTYKIEVKNLGGVVGVYDLSDAPGFDDDIVVGTVSYTSTVPGNPGGPLAGAGPWKLADDQAIVVGNVHTYTLTMKVTIDLNPGTSGDNVYNKCGQSSPGNPKKGEGLFNEALVDSNNDGVTDDTSRICGDLPYVTSTKVLTSTTALGGNMYQVNYLIQVKNLGGAVGQYDLKDVPGYEDDITIGSASYTSTAPGNAGGALAGVGPWTLANDQNIAIGATHDYVVSVKVTIDMRSTSGGDNVYKACESTTPGQPKAGEGLYNKAVLDNNNDGTPEETDEACGDLPFVTHEKIFSSVSLLGVNMFQVNYKIVVKNLGGAVGQYNLIDAPAFDDDIAISNPSYTSNAPGNAGGNLAGSGPWTLANDQSIAVGATHTYDLTAKVTYDATPASGGDNKYKKCGLSNPNLPVAGEGLFNQSRLDNNDDGIPEETDEVCGDLPDIAKYGSKVWNDLDGDGRREAGEPGIPNVTVILYDAVTNVAERVTTTDANGKYLFENLKSKAYYAKYVLPSGYVYTIPNVGLDSLDSDVDGSNGPGTNGTTVLDFGEEELINDVGMFQCATISGDVWFDLDMDGIYDPAEKGINGLRVYIIDAMTGATVTTLTTSVKPGTPSDDGYYIASCLKPGMYYVKFERPGHLGASEPYKGTNPNKDSDISHENGVNTTKKITLNPGQNVLNVGGGFQTKSIVGDKVWIDKNYNGLQDNGEVPLPNVKVAAYNSKGTMVSEGTTGIDGQFVLDGMIQGDYYVKFEVPNQAYGFTVAHAGVDDMDSDVDGTNGYGTTKMYRILSGEVRPTIDAGVVAQVLAVDWLSFDGQYNGNFTELNWSTKVDINNHHFVVERRHESETDFKEIGNVDANQDFNLAQHDYDFDDYDVNLSGVYYYRIKQIDKNERFTYSRIISIQVKVDESLNAFIYPNPVNDKLKVELWLPEDSELEAKVFDNTGKAVLVAPFSEFKTKGKYNELLETSSLVPGQYVLQIKTTSGVINKKFTVSR
ncbi:MAG: SdrD B-like domain-containing protein [Saprospiraceae bacterium]